MDWSPVVGTRIRLSAEEWYPRSADVPVRIVTPYGTYACRTEAPNGDLCGDRRVTHVRRISSDSRA
jgi:hypothetical protein